MVRVKRGVQTRRKHNKLKKQVKGMIQSRQTSIKRAHTALIHKKRDAYIGRKLRKRDMRKLWIMRINAACRQNGTKYSKFMNDLQKADINLNRKVLSQIAFEDADKFSELVKQVTNG